MRKNIKRKVPDEIDLKKKKIAELNSQLESIELKIYQARIEKVKLMLEINADFRYEFGSPLNDMDKKLIVSLDLKFVEKLFMILMGQMVQYQDINLDLMNFINENFDLDMNYLWGYVHYTILYNWNEITMEHLRPFASKIDF